MSASDVPYVTAEAKPRRVGWALQAHSSVVENRETSCADGKFTRAKWIVQSHQGTVILEHHPCLFWDQFVTAAEPSLSQLLQNPFWIWTHYFDLMNFLKLKQEGKQVVGFFSIAPQIKNTQWIWKPGPTRTSCSVCCRKCFQYWITDWVIFHSSPVAYTIMRSQCCICSFHFLKILNKFCIYLNEWINMQLARWNALGKVFVGF